MSEQAVAHERIRLMRAIERRAGIPLFARDPYVKFLPLIFQPAELDWSLAGRCDPKSTRRIVIPAYGRDPIAYQGWLRFAVLAAYSVLHCVGSEAWAVDVLLGPDPTQYTDLPAADLFGESVDPTLTRLRSHGVTVICCEGLKAPGDIYRAYNEATAILIRMDADSGLLPAALAAPCFSFDQPLGYSGLNARHTQRNACAQLTHPEEGRMLHWPVAMRASAWEWVDSLVRLCGLTFGANLDCCTVMDRIKAVPWLSEGLSYMRGALAGDFVLLRNILVGGGLVPDWDEECVKLAMVGIMGLAPEPARIPVLEYWEYSLHTPDAAVVNFRNRRSLGAEVYYILEDADRRRARLRYVGDFALDVTRRAAARRTL